MRVLWLALALVAACAEEEPPPPSCEELGCPEAALCDGEGRCYCYVPDAGHGVECVP